MSLRFTSRHEAQRRAKAQDVAPASMHSATELAAGVASLPSTASALAAAHTAWRFLKNERVTSVALVQPLRQDGCVRLAQTNAPFGLLIHVWSQLGCTAGKRDLTQVTQLEDLGYDLSTALLVSGDDGRPLAPMEMYLKTAACVLSTRV